MHIGQRRFCFSSLATLFAFAAAAYAGETATTDVAFRARIDDSEQRYIQILPAGLTTRRPCDVLIALHGHGSDRHQFAEQSRDECRAARDVAAKHAMIFIAPDYRAPTSWMGPAAEADLVQIIEDVKRRYAVRHVVVSGGSMGGTASLTFAALHPELVDGVVAMNGTANLLEFDGFQEAIRSSFGGTKPEIAAEYKRRSAEYWPERLTMPIASTTGGRDRIVPPESAVRLLGVLKKLDRPVLSLHRPDAGHATGYDDAAAAFEFVLRQLAERRM